MNYGLYVSASGVLTNLYRQDVFANNLANSETAAFKPDIATVRQRDPEALESQLPGMRHDLLDRLGGGAWAGPQYIDFSVGSLQQTNRPLDAALPETNQFFAVQYSDAAGQPGFRLTRDGRFMLNSYGELVTTAGHQVLDTDDQPIRVDPTQPVTLDGRGGVQQNGNVIAQLQITSVADPKLLIKSGQGLFKTPAGADIRRPNENPSIRVGFVESSGVDPVKTLNDLVAATRAVTANGNMIRYHDSTMDRAVNVLGRVA